ncbi:MAG: hypothetical protein Q7R39_14535 [Dehalococcoidia bacterium]|nr:hypothetical protein [Dehalococcoidia bacterium]
MGEQVRGKLRKIRRWVAVPPWLFTRPAWLLRSALITLPAWLLLAPLLSIVHQTLVLMIAASLQAVSTSLLLKNALIQAGFDPVYASVLNRTLGNIEARGMAVAEPLGGWLHQLVPQFFVSPNQVVPGAWATALLGEGASLLSSAIAMIGAETILIAMGMTLFWIGIRNGASITRFRFMMPAVLGIALQARGIGGLLSLRFSIADIEIMGLSHLFTKVVPVNSGEYGQVLADPLATRMADLLPLFWVLTIYGTAFAAAVLLKGSSWRRWVHTLRLMALEVRWPKGSDGRRLGMVAVLAAAVLLSASLSQGMFPALANYDYYSDPAGASGQPLSDSEGARGQPIEATASSSEAPQLPPPSTPRNISGPSKVVISRASDSYSYTVNSIPDTIRGVGYNPMYSQLPAEERASRYDRDFSQMRDAGVNTILGWDKDQFDDLALQKAQEYGIGIVLPYHLPYDGDYGNPAYEEAIEKDVSGWVKHFRGQPALRMWGIGNEVIHSLGKNPNTPRARAFAKFYVRLADTVHTIDPDHPVTYRDAEDMYLGPIREALKKDDIHRPWFVFGMNFFTLRVCQALTDWPKRNMDVPVMISEFAPTGLKPNDRPKGYTQLLDCIAKQNPDALGGFAYVWFTNGPEAIDRVMGLVDSDGRPVDGSLHALGKAFRHEGDGLE